VEISRLNEATFLIGRIDPVLAELLRRIVPSADPGDNEQARERIFSSPTEDANEERFFEDWQELVQPELAKLFQSSLEVIEGDLKKMHSNAATGEATLSMPSDHLEAWIHGLNQARLVLSERFQLYEEEMEANPPPANDPKSFLMLQLHMYAYLQELFLRLLEHR
jgi:hypothetical protein